jgi:hypothetical protein
MATIDDILAWQWPQDKHEQGVAVSSFCALLTTLVGEWENTVIATLQINKDTEPTLADWQTAWVSAGRALPIRAGTKLYWYSQTAEKLMSAYLYYDDAVVKLTLPTRAGGAGLFPFAAPATTVTPLANSAEVYLLTDVNYRFTLPQSAWLVINIPMTLINGGGSAETHRIGYLYVLDGGVYPPSDGGVYQFQNTSCGVTPTSEMHTQIFKWLHPIKLAAGEHSLRVSGIRYGTATVATVHTLLQVPYSANIYDVNNNILAATPQAVTMEAIYD